MYKQATEMTSFKYPHKKRPNPGFHMSFSNLRKENASLKKTLVEMTRQHSEHNRLLEKFLSLEIDRLKSSQQLTAEGGMAALLSEQLSKKEGNLVLVGGRISGACSETEEIKNQLEDSSATAQELENQVAGKEDWASKEQLSTNDVTDLQHQLRDALEKNKQWLEYDQQREAYVRTILARMSWLEEQSKEANEACSQQHNKDYSDEQDRMREMQEHYERLLQKANDHLEVLREKLDITQHDLNITQNRCMEWERQVEELKQQQQSRQCCCEVEEQQLDNETKELLGELDKEKRRSANFELQGNLFQRFMVNHHHADQEKIADLERQIKITLHDLEDEQQDCSYLRKQMVRVLKMLQKSEDHLTEQSKRDQQDSHEATHPPCQPTRDNLPSSRHSSLLNESFLECPVCRAEYPASHYRELMSHLESCLD